MRSLVIAGLFTLLVPVLAASGGLDVRSLVACRFLAGLGVGGVIPNVLAMTAEYARAIPRVHRQCGVSRRSVG